MKKRNMWAVAGLCLLIGSALFGGTEEEVKKEEPVKEVVKTEEKEAEKITLDDYLTLLEATLETNFDYSTVSYDATKKFLNIHVGNEGIGDNIAVFHQLGTYPPEWKTATNNIDLLAGEVYLAVSDIEKGVQISFNISNYDDKDLVLYSTLNGVTVVYDVLGDLK